MGVTKWYQVSIHDCSVGWNLSGRKNTAAVKRLTTCFLCIIESRGWLCKIGHSRAFREGYSSLLYLVHTKFTRMIDQELELTVANIAGAVMPCNMRAKRLMSSAFQCFSLQQE
jgi:hypothetical protein